MKKFIAIGLGNFGFNLAKSLEKNHCDVLGIDISRDLVERAKDDISHAVIGDATNREVLQALMLKDFDGAIVSLGQDMAASILIALHLIEIGVKKVIVRAVSEEHGKILSLIGVHEVIFPERDMAVKLADKLSMRNALDFLPLAGDYGIVEIVAPKVFVGKNLIELQITAKYHCQIVGIKIGKRDKLVGKDDRVVQIPPSAKDLIIEGSTLIVIGKYDDIAKIEALVD